ncbi:P-II family nitrogen regulator [Candidatus Contubernalis alkaliaceticus]|uniref:P-II family nitrogen regulator n=1 Tax=Candidatus Contubernalis alkaliaceticus TaxID=338645 RepID=UPI001F4C0AF1|nr:P-II family nitrogen regulator [Candidatus Contubernalis alkalaceticus]UNC92600.1 hypothetical protein HUE98_11110 [Candidatus Contubernalis alkalaceticus]
MKLLVLVLNKTDELNELLEGFIDIGIRGATVIDSTGMGRILSNHVPLFGGLSHLFSGERPANKVIFSIIHECHLQEAINLVKRVVGEFKEPGTGIIFTLDVDNVFGLADNIKDCTQSPIE